MAITGTFDVDGRTYRFRKPHVGPVMRFNETIAAAEKGDASLVDVLGASLAVIHDAVARVDPSVTRDQLADALDEEDLRNFQSAVMRLIGAKEVKPGEAGGP